MANCDELKHSNNKVAREPMAVNTKSSHFLSFAEDFFPKRFL